MAERGKSREAIERLGRFGPVEVRRCPARGLYGVFCTPSITDATHALLLRGLVMRPRIRAPALGFCLDQ